MNHFVRWATAASLAMSLGSRAESDVYSLTDDFSIASNPVGAWSYGYTDSLGGPFISMSTQVRRRASSIGTTTSRPVPACDTVDETHTQVMPDDDHRPGPGRLQIRSPMWLLHQAILSRHARCSNGTSGCLEPSFLHPRARFRFSRLGAAHSRCSRWVMECWMRNRAQRPSQG